jgi:hypothetical protein
MFRPTQPSSCVQISVHLYILSFVLQSHMTDDASVTWVSIIVVNASEGGYVMPRGSCKNRRFGGKHHLHH